MTRFSQRKTDTAWDDSGGLAALSAGLSALVRSARAGAPTGAKLPGRAVPACERRSCEGMGRAIPRLYPIARFSGA